jgi:N-acetylmuramoyl-L-alanine amidase
MTDMILREGDRSMEVVDIQTRLRSLGMHIEDEPGFFGASTKQAIRAFQQRRGVVADGIVGRHTWNELVESGWKLGDRTLYPKHPPFRGDDVLALQGRLNALGFDAGREDGILGPDTDRAVRAFQREYGVAEDGIVGPRTYTALTGLRIDRPITAAGLREELRRTERGGIHGSLVVVDPGHGGGDPGERGPNGVVEADMCWDIARRLASRLAMAGARVRFTRSEANGVDESERAQRANSMGGELFISLHLNSHHEPTAEGASTYYFRTSRTGALLAEHVQNELAELGLRDCRCHPSYYPILKETRMPAILVEPAHVTNPDDTKRLDDPGFREAIAGAIARAVASYYAAAS